MRPKEDSGSSLKNPGDKGDSGETKHPQMTEPRGS
jgi:hypothetical protein